MTCLSESPPGHFGRKEIRISRDELNLEIPPPPANLAKSHSVPRRVFASAGVDVMDRRWDAAATQPTSIRNPQQKDGWGNGPEEGGLRVPSPSGDSLLLTSHTRRFTRERKHDSANTDGKHDLRLALAPRRGAGICW